MHPDPGEHSSFNVYWAGTWFRTPWTVAYPFPFVTGQRLWIAAQATMYDSMPSTRSITSANATT